MELGHGTAAKKFLCRGLNNGFNPLPMVNSRGIKDEAAFDANNIRAAVHVGEDRVAICDHSRKERQPNQISHKPADRKTTRRWARVRSRFQRGRVLCRWVWEKLWKQNAILEVRHIDILDRGQITYRVLLEGGNKVAVEYEYPQKLSDGEIGSQNVRGEKTCLHGGFFTSNSRVG